MTDEQTVIGIEQGKDFFPAEKDTTPRNLLIDPKADYGMAQSALYNVTKVMRNLPELVRKKHTSYPYKGGLVEITYTQREGLTDANLEDIFSDFSGKVLGAIMAKAYKNKSHKVLISIREILEFMGRNPDKGTHSAEETQRILNCIEVWKGIELKTTVPKGKGKTLVQGFNFFADVGYEKDERGIKYITLTVCDGLHFTKEVMANIQRLKSRRVFAYLYLEAKASQGYYKPFRLREKEIYEEMFRKDLTANKTVIVQRCNKYLKEITEATGYASSEPLTGKLDHYIKFKPPYNPRGNTPQSVSELRLLGEGASPKPKTPLLKENE